MATFKPICGVCENYVFKIEDENGNVEWNHIGNAKCSGPYKVKLERPGLNEVMDLDRVIRVDKTGRVMPVPLLDWNGHLEMYLVGSLEEYRWDDDFYVPEGWELLSGFTGQYGYNGPVMHASEFIGGGLERHILETPGYWVATVVESDCQYKEPNCNEDSGCNCDPAGWAVAHKPFTDTETGD